MRKIVMLNRLSLDGYYAGPNGEIDWFVPDPEVEAAAHQMMHPDTALLGRVTYQMFQGYWPGVAKNPQASPGEKKMADELNQMTKLVLSRSLNDAAWENTRLLKEDAIRTVQQIRQGDGADIVLFGSGQVAQQLAKQGLIDEYVLIITPKVLGVGKSFYTDVRPFELKLLSSLVFKSGNVILHYQHTASV